MAHSASLAEVVVGCIKRFGRQHDDFGDPDALNFSRSSMVQALDHILSSQRRIPLSGRRTFLDGLHALVLRRVANRPAEQLLDVEDLVDFLRSSQCKGHAALRVADLEQRAIALDSQPLAPAAPPSEPAQGHRHWARLLLPAMPGVVVVDEAQAQDQAPEGSPDEPDEAEEAEDAVGAVGAPKRLRPALYRDKRNVARKMKRWREKALAAEEEVGKLKSRACCQKLFDFAQKNSCSRSPEDPPPVFARRWVQSCVPT